MGTFGTPVEIREAAHLDAKAILEQAITHLGLSDRAHDKTLRLARTLNRGLL